MGGEAVEKFCKSNASTVGGLERAYITSRYIPIEFKEEEVKEMLDFCRKLRELVNGI